MMRTLLRAAALLGLLVISRPVMGQSGAAGSASPSASTSAPATLAPGDILRIKVWRRDEFSGDFVIASDGTITHPLYRAVRAVDIPLSELESRLRTFLTRFETEPAFVVTPLFRVVVGGEVRQPNVHTIVPGTTLAQVVAMSGGPTERGRLDRVRLIRDGQSRFVDLTSASAVASHLEVQSGDQILVGRSTSFFRDVAAPAGSVIAAFAALISVVVQLSR